MSDLPTNWAKATLGDLLSGIEAGNSFKCDERTPTTEEVGVVKVSAVTWGEYKESESKTCTDASRIAQGLIIEPGDFLFSRANTIALVGACVIAGATRLRVMLSDKILRLRFLRDDLKPWALHFLRSKGGRAQIESLASGNQESMRNIGQERLRQIEIPLPPHSERARIVAKLEELLSDLDAGVAELKAARKKMQQYRKSLLKAAVEGALTADWREAQRQLGTPTETGAQLLARILTERRARWAAKQLARFRAQGNVPPRDWQEKYPEPVTPDTTDLPTVPEGWAWARVDHAGEVQLGRQRAPQFHSGTNMVPYLRVANVFEDRIDISDVMEMHFSAEDETTYKLNHNDILLNEGQSLELVGRPAIYRNELPKACFTNTLVRFRAETSVLPEYALAIFLHYMHSGRFQKIAKITTNIAHLGAGRFSELEFPLPSTSEQSEIVRLLSWHFALIQRQQEEIERALKRSYAQRQNILRAAFAGQLVPQHAGDEPACALLERIRTARTERPSMPKARKTKKYAEA